MEIIFSIAVVLSIVIVFLMYPSKKTFQPNSTQKNTFPPVITWPVLGMLPGVLMNSHRILDYLTEIMEHSNGTFIFKGPWFTTVQYVITSDPTNVHYILSKNFRNFPKGPDFKEIFEILGGGILNAEGDSWHSQRNTSLSLLRSDNFENFVATTVWNKSETCLIPILNIASENEAREIDMKDLFNRVAFDCAMIMALGHDPCSLHADLPDIPELKAFEDALEAAWQRHVLPQTYWRILKWFQIGTEKKLSQSVVILDRFLNDCITLKRQNKLDVDGNHDSDMLTSYLRKFPEENDLFFRDTMFSFMFAGKDTISSTLCWFFYMIAKYPEEQNKIRKTLLANSPSGKWEFSNTLELKELFYLHAALCETLRLFPAVPINHKAPIKPDMLPSGHQITGNMRTLLPFYSMGRMESIWGKDCREFKPERWIAENGKDLISVPSYKFTAFNAGAKSCIGKDMSFIQLKIVAASVISRFHIELIEGHVVAPAPSIGLHMKHGLKVKVSKIV